MLRWLVLGLVVALPAIVLAGYWRESAPEALHQPVDPTKMLQQLVQPPRQAPASGSIISFKDYQLTLLATYDITARVLGRENYRLDREAGLAPVDLALGWQYMARPDILAKIELDQKLRFYWWRTQDTSVDLNAVALTSANVHIIPANATIKRQINRLTPHDVVRLKGYLVEAQAPDGWQWRSSLTRDDTGRGACELFWVTKVETAQ